jgi:hypothetical protein
VREQQKFLDGPTIFTDVEIYKQSVRSTQTKLKVAWLVEPRELQPRFYRWLNKTAKLYHRILTFDRETLDRWDHAHYFPLGGCWLMDETIRLWPKSPRICMIYSGKRETKAQKLRHHVARVFGESVELYGRADGVPTVHRKDEVLPHYQYAIEIENSAAPGYFSEKLIDCLACGTIPLYRGDPEIGRFFNVEGIWRWNTLDELARLIRHIERCPDPPRLVRDAVNANFRKAQQYLAIGQQLEETLAQWL